MYNAVNLHLFKQFYVAIRSVWLGKHCTSTWKKRKVLIREEDCKVSLFISSPSHSLPSGRGTHYQDIWASYTTKSKTQTTTGRYWVSGCPPCTGHKILCQPQLGSTAETCFISQRPMELSERGVGWQVTLVHGCWSVSSVPGPHHLCCPIAPIVSVSCTQTATKASQTHNAFQSSCQKAQKPVASVAEHLITSAVSSAWHIFLVYLFVKVEISTVTQSVL